jgi:hypothetical protein
LKESVDWTNGQSPRRGLASGTNSKDAGQIQTIAFWDATASLLYLKFASERSFTEPSGPLKSTFYSNIWTSELKGILL